jgi:HEAT repeat protein
MLPGCNVVAGPYRSSPLAKPAVDRLLSSEELLQKEAVVELSSLGEHAMPELVARFAEASVSSRIQILNLAITIREPGALVAEVFALAAADEDATVRFAAASSATKLPEYADLLSPVMQTLLSDPLGDIRATALATLGGFPGYPRPEASELLGLLKDRDAIVAATASNLALKRREPYVQAAARATLPRLIGALRAPQPSTRAACLLAIGQFGVDASPAVAPISNVLKSDPVPEVRLQAALALRRIGTPAALTLATKYLDEFKKHPDPVISKAAKAAL